MRQSGILSGTSPQRLVLRARIVLSAAAGMPNAQIARDLGCSVSVVREWRRRFARLGLPGIFDKPRSGRPAVHGPSTRLAVIAIATSVPPPGTVLISIDEKTGIQAKPRIRPDIPGRPGRDARREFEYQRHGTVSIIAAMNVATRIRRNDSVTFMSFPLMLDQSMAPGLRIHLIMDNGSGHRPHDRDTA